MALSKTTGVPRAAVGLAPMVGCKVASLPSYTLLYAAETRLRGTMPIPVVGKDECERLYRRMLAGEGVARADEAYVQPGRDPLSSNPGWQFDAQPPKPFLALGTAMYDRMTVIHEASHQLIQLSKGRFLQPAEKDQWVAGQVAHDQEWTALYFKMLQKYAPDIGDGLQRLLSGKEEWQENWDRSWAASKMAAGARTLYRGLSVLIPEPQRPTRDSLLAACQTAGGWNLGTHWSASEEVAQRFGGGMTGKPHEPQRRPGQIERRRGEWMENPYDKARGFQVSVLLEAEVAEGTDPGAWRMKGYDDLAGEDEVTLAPGTPVHLKAISWFNGGRWERFPIDLRTTAAKRRLWHLTTDPNFKLDPQFRAYDKYRGNSETALFLSETKDLGWWLTWTVAREAETPDAVYAVQVEVSTDFLSGERGDKEYRVAAGSDARILKVVPASEVVPDYKQWMERIIEAMEGGRRLSLLKMAAAGVPLQVQQLADQFASRVPEYEDPMQADGACVRTEFQFRTFCQQHPGVSYKSWYVIGALAMSKKRKDFLDYYGDRPERMTHNASCISLDAGKSWWVIDFTYRQFDETSPWPLVESEAAFLARWQTHEEFNFKLATRAWKTASEDYRGGHQPPKDAPPIHDLLAVEQFPKDVYETLQHYTFGETGPETERLIRQVRGKPEAMVTVYRAVPPWSRSTRRAMEPVINTGDWVAVTEGYAREHGDEQGWEEWVEPKNQADIQDDEGWVQHEGGWWILSAKVPAKYVRNGGNDLIEWGYWGPTIPAKVKKLRKYSALDLEGWISVAEHAMENHGVQGKTFEVPRGHQDDPDYKARIKPYIDFARKALASEGLADEWVNVCTSDYILKQEGYPQALVTASNLIVLRPTSNEMTILHEVAHIVTRSPEGSHTRAFVEVAHRLYTRFLGPKAGEVFWNLVGMKVESRTAFVHGTYPIREFIEEVDEGRIKPFAGGVLKGWLQQDGSLVAVDDHNDYGSYRNNFGRGSIRLMLNSKRSVYQDPFLGLEWWLAEDYDEERPTEQQRRAIITLINEFGLELYQWSVSNADGKAYDDGSTRYKAELGNYLRQGVHASKTAMYHVRCSDGHVRWGPHGAAGVLFKNGDRYYLVKRGAGVDQGGSWGIPGGAIDDGETPEQAAKREAREEVGYDGPWRVIHTYVDQPCPEWAFTTFVVEVDKQHANEENFDWETDEDGWFTHNEIMGLYLHPAFRAALPNLLRGASKKTAAGSTYYHLTSKVDFKLDPKKGPLNNRTLGGEMQPGIFLTQDPSYWAQGYGYWQPWVVEFDVPPDVLSGEGIIESKGNREVYIPATLYSRIRLIRVMPLDAHCREAFGDYGWVEASDGVTFDTEEPIPNEPYRPGKFRGWRYQSDARRTDSGWQARYKKRVEKYRRAQGKGIYVSKLAAGKPYTRGFNPVISQGQAEALLTCLNQNRLSDAARLVVEYAHTDMTATHSGVGSWWASETPEIVGDMYGSGGNLQRNDDGTWEFKSYGGKVKLGVNLVGLPQARPTLQSTYFDPGTEFVIQKVRLYYDDAPPYGYLNSKTHGWLDLPANGLRATAINIREWGDWKVQDRWNYAKPYMAVVRGDGQGGSMVSGSTVAKVEVQMRDDLFDVIRRVTQEAKQKIAQDSNPVWTDRDYHLRAGGQQGTFTLLSAPDKRLDWGKPVSFHDPSRGDTKPLTEFYDAWRHNDHEGCWYSFSVNIVRAIPEKEEGTFDRWPTLKTKPNKPNIAIVYRGVKLMAGQDPATAERDAARGGGMGTSWTTSERTAIAVAERGGAGFTGDNRPGQKYHIRPGKDSNPSVPTVFRAEVDINSGPQGAALYTMNDYGYLSEQEVDIPTGVALTLTGWKQATPIPVNPADVKAVEQNKPPDRATGTEAEWEAHFNGPRGYDVIWKWSGWKAVRIKRVGAFGFRPGEMPPRPGTQSVPAGHARLFTRVGAIGPGASAEVIARDGLRLDKAGIYKGPGGGEFRTIWCSGGAPDVETIKNSTCVVEFTWPWDGSATPGSTYQIDSDITPSDFLAVYEQWHAIVWMLQDWGLETQPGESTDAFLKRMHWQTAPGSEFDEPEWQKAMTYLRSHWGRLASKTAGFEIEPGALEEIKHFRGEHLGAGRQLTICGTVSAQIEKALGWPKETGWYSGPEASGRQIHMMHAWNRLPNGQVLDATADQMGHPGIWITDGSHYKIFTAKEQRFIAQWMEDNYGIEPDAFDMSFADEDEWHEASRSRVSLEHGRDDRRTGRRRPVAALGRGAPNQGCQPRRVASDGGGLRRLGAERGVNLTRNAQRDLEKLPSDLRREVIEALRGLARGEGNIKALKGWRKFYRLRVADKLRVVYEDQGGLGLEVHLIKRRSEVYEVMKRRLGALAYIPGRGQPRDAPLPVPIGTTLYRVVTIPAEVIEGKQGDGAIAEAVLAHIQGHQRGEVLRNDTRVDNAVGPHWTTNYDLAKGWLAHPPWGTAIDPVGVLIAASGWQEEDVWRDAPSVLPYATHEQEITMKPGAELVVEFLEVAIGQSETFTREPRPARRLRWGGGGRVIVRAKKTAALPMVPGGLYFHVAQTELPRGTKLVPGGPGGAFRSPHAPADLGEGFIREDGTIIDARGNPIGKREGGGHADWRFSWVWLAPDATLARGMALKRWAGDRHPIFYLARVTGYAETSHTDYKDAVVCTEAEIVARYPGDYEAEKNLTTWDPTHSWAYNGGQALDYHLEKWRDSVITGRPFERLEEMKLKARAAAGQTVRLFHGTNQAALESIRRDGQFRPADHHKLAGEIEDRYGLPRDSVWNSSSYGFNRGFRAGDQTVYFTTDFTTASRYAQIGSEAINDALGGAYDLVHDAYDDEGMFKPGMADAKSPWIKAETEKHYSPVVLTVEVPFEVYLATYGDRWRGGPPTPEEVHGDIALPAPIPVSWIVGTQKVAVSIEAPTHESLLMYHGTTRAAWEEIKRNGFARTPDPLKLCHDIEDEFKLPRGSVWKLQNWSKKRRKESTVNNLYLTTDRKQAEGYAYSGSAPLYDALVAAYQVAFPEKIKQDFFGVTAEGLQPWLREQILKRGGGPVLIAFDVPEPVIRESWEVHQREMTYRAQGGLTWKQLKAWLLTGQYVRQDGISWERQPGTNMVRYVESVEMLEQPNRIRTQNSKNGSNRPRARASVAV